MTARALPADLGGFVRSGLAGRHFPLADKTPRRVVYDPQPAGVVVERAGMPPSFLQ